MADWYADLAAELAGGHPVTGAYNVDNQLAADEINAVNRTRNRTSATGKEIKDQIQTVDWNSRSDAQKAQLLSLFARDDLDPFGIDADIFTEAMSGHTGTTVADLNAWRVEDISRATELGFPVVTSADVYAARL